MSKWNQLSGVDELLDEKDTCNVKKCPFKNVTGFKTHITSNAKKIQYTFSNAALHQSCVYKKNVSCIQAYIKNCIRNQDKFGYSLKKNDRRT